MNFGGRDTVVVIQAFRPSHTFCYKHIDRLGIFNFQQNTIPYDCSRIRQTTLNKLIFGFGIKKLRCATVLNLLV